jgi:myo-inositol-1(or 4)-monophosphatase
LTYSPALGELFVAEKGSGAFCNGERLRVSTRRFEEALVATGFPFRGKEMLDDYLKCFKEVFLTVSGIRRCGSAALDLAYTAKGVFDGFWEMALHPWDVAAGVLLIEEAGGRV